MTESPETPTPSLSERLITEAGILSNLGYPGRVNETIGLLAEAAVQVLDMEAQLRHLDRIKAERDALAAVVGDLWDNPPDDGPDCGPTDPAGYRLYLAERYGDDVAETWDRLRGTTGYSEDGDRWTLEADDGA